MDSLTQVTIYLGQSSLQEGLLYALMTLGVYLSFRVLDYADLTVDGSLPLGAAITAVLISQGINPWLATLVAIGGGLLAGAATAFLHTHLKIAPLLSGILMMTALYSVNLRVMGGKANIPLLRTETVFTQIESLNLGLTRNSAIIFLTLLTVIIVFFILYFFLETEIGVALRATGDNEKMVTSQGVDIRVMKIIGLSLSNGLVALSGALVAQTVRSADIGMGVGTIIAGLASVIIGQSLFGRGSVLRDLIAVIFGSVIYRLIIAIVLLLGLPATDLKLMTALIVIIALAYPVIMESRERKKGSERYASDHKSN